MNRRYHSLTLISFILVALISCGGTGGAPGSDTGKTGIMIKSALLQMTTPDIDTFIDCCTTDATGKCTATETPLTRESATLAVVTENLTPDISTSQFPAKIQECTISYVKANNDPAAPIIETLTLYPNCTLAAGENTCDVTIIDIDRKLQYSDPVIRLATHVPSEYPTHYIANMECKYTNNFGISGYFQSVIDIWLADFNRC